VLVQSTDRNWACWSRVLDPFLALSSLYVALTFVPGQLLGMQNLGITDHQLHKLNQNRLPQKCYLVGIPFLYCENPGGAVATEAKLLLLPWLE